MPDVTYNVEEYKRFHENLLPLLSGPNIQHPSMRKLRKLAALSGTKTKFGSVGWRSMVSSRIAPKTVYLGSEKVRLPKISDLQKSIIEKAPEELHKILHLLRSLP
jgi:phosphoenolpyruvate carboxykinase (ATP)